MATRMAEAEPAGAEARLQELEARAHRRVQRAHAIAELDALFRAGSAPDPLPIGFQPGRLLTMSVTPAIDALVRRIADAWMPWKGKAFDPSTMTGINIMTADARAPLRLLFGERPEPGPDGRMEVFPFRNRIAPGAVDPAVTTLKIDYDFPANVDFIRRILDELVQIGDGVYLGKILFRTRSGFHPIGFFSLQNPTQP
ncbi:MAG TPA: hypothetical protein VEO00_10450 [Actinomycetota bacterium]|nr:hypothetical protein [Actinomycetota bacterium]